MIEEIKNYMQKSESHYLRTFNIGNRGVAEFCANGQDFNYRMFFINDHVGIHKGTNLTRHDDKDNIISTTVITMSEYKEIMEIVKSYI